MSSDDSKGQFGKWIETTDGTLKTVISIATSLGTIATLSSKTAGDLMQRIGLPSYASYIALGAVLAIIVGWFAVGYRSYANASKIARLEKFNVEASTPDSLIGRKDDLNQLCDEVKRSRIVLLDGESGCGKSALVSAGLLITLSNEKSLLPCLIRNWGENWVAGPLASALDALHRAIPPDQVSGLAWPSPDLARPVKDLADDLAARLKAAFEKLHRQALLIVDQFDDYQLQHRGDFIDKEGNWIDASALAQKNAFWAVVKQGIDDNQLHLLVVTRSDAAAGLVSVRFFNDQVKGRTLWPIDADYIDAVLESVAPPQANPPVVSNPQQGWNELKSRLRRDFAANGAILMQQVRTVLLGLRQLPALTVKAYDSAGGMRGVEVLFVARAVDRAAGKIGGTPQSKALVRKLLATFVLHGSPTQAPKSQQVLETELRTVGEKEQIDAVVGSLIRDEVLRSAAGAASAWRLDHDYLARAVVAEAKRADIWQAELEDAAARFNQVGAGWSARWAALLPPQKFSRLLWESVRRHVTIRGQRKYFWLSAIKPALLLAVFGSVALIYFVRQRDEALTGEAVAIIDAFGVAGEADAVLKVWRAPENLRQRVYDRIEADPHLVQRASATAWGAAHAGFEPRRIDEALDVMRDGLISHECQTAATILYALPGEVPNASALRFGNVMVRATDQAKYIAQAKALRRLLVEQHFGAQRFDFQPQGLVEAYVAAVGLIDDQATLTTEWQALSADFAQVRGSPLAAPTWAQAAAAVASKLEDDNQRRQALGDLKLLLDGENHYTEVLEAYAKLAARFSAKEDTLAAMQVIGNKFAQPGWSRAPHAALYMDLFRKLKSDQDVHAAFTQLQSDLDHSSAFSPDAIRVAYVGALEKIGGRNEIVKAAGALRGDLKDESPSPMPESVRDELIRGYASLVGSIGDQGFVASELHALHQIISDNHPMTLRKVSLAYSYLAEKLSDQAAIRAETESFAADFAADKDDADYELTADLDARLAVRLPMTERAAVAKFLLQQWQGAEVKFPGKNGFLADHCADVAISAGDTALLDRERQFAESLLVNDAAGEYILVFAILSAASNDENIRLKAADKLQNMMEHSSNFELKGRLAQSFAIVLRDMTTLNNVQDGLRVLRGNFEAANDEYSTSAYATAYAMVARVLVARTIPAPDSELVHQILVDSSHPFLKDPATLLSALTAATGKDISRDPVAAGVWLKQQANISMSALRPSPAD